MSVPERLSRQKLGRAEAKFMTDPGHSGALVLVEVAVSGCDDKHALTS